MASLKRSKSLAAMTPRGDEEAAEAAPVRSSSHDELLSDSAPRDHEEITPGEENSSKDSVASRLEQRHHAVNSMFGFLPWKSHVARRDISTRSRAVQELYTATVVAVPPPEIERFITIGNIAWAVFFGWWLSSLYAIASAFMFVSYVGAPYGRRCWELAGYFLWPFGKYLHRESSLSRAGLSYNSQYNYGSNSTIPSARGQGRVTQPTARRSTPSPIFGGDLEEADRVESRAAAIISSPASASYTSFVSSSSAFENSTSGRCAKIIFYIFAIPLLAVGHSIASALTWFIVVMIPMAKINWTAIGFLNTSILDLRVGQRLPPHAGADMILCTYQAVNTNYFKYAIGGMNVVLVNLLPFVGLSLFFGFLTPEHWREDPGNSVIIFACSLLSIIPLAYYIGMAVSSISAQASFAVGAVLNATFGSIVELILYAFTVKKGFRVLTQQAITGSLLGTMLLLPGLSMIFGGIRHKEQRFNQNAAGVSAVLLLIAVIGVMTPTVFYSFYGSYDLHCRHFNSTGTEFYGSRCTYVENPNYDNDPVYINSVKPLMYTCALILPIAYCIGLLFTLKTHKHLYEKKEDEDEAEEEDIPEWSKGKCLAILIAATTCFALVAESMTDRLQVALDSLGIDPYFAGLTVIGIIPNVAEFVNAIQFALQNNISLALEIGNVGAIQISLIQMPALVFLSSIMFNGDEGVGKTFTLIFERLDLFAVLFSVLIVNYISIDGKANYFEGTALCIIYALIVSAFYFVKKQDFNELV